MPWIRRRESEELIDAPNLDLSGLEISLKLVSATNRWPGGTRALLTALRGIGPDVGRVLDVGTGNGDIPLALAQWMGQRGFSVGVDLHPQVVEIARKRLGARDGVALVHADGLALPFLRSSFDAVVSALTLHHLKWEGAIQLIREMGRVARHRVVISDLERHPVSWLAARAFALTLWRHSQLTRHDGPLSVLRSFTPTELYELGRAAGLEHVRVRRYFPFRLVLTGEPSS